MDSDAVRQARTQQRMQLAGAVHVDPDKVAKTMLPIVQQVQLSTLPHLTSAAWRLLYRLASAKHLDALSSLCQAAAAPLRSVWSSADLL